MSHTTLDDVGSAASAKPLRGINSHPNTARQHESRELSRHSRAWTDRRPWPVPAFPPDTHTHTHRKTNRKTSTKHDTNPWSVHRSIDTQTQNRTRQTHPKKTKKKQMRHNPTNTHTLHASSRSRGDQQQKHISTTWKCKERERIGTAHCSSQDERSSAENTTKCSQESGSRNDSLGPGATFFAIHSLGPCQGSFFGYFFLDDATVGP